MNTNFALGEETPEETTCVWIRHAVINATRSSWARALCSAELRVWVHEVAGNTMPFPGPFGDEVAGACPECLALVESAQKTAAEKTKPLRRVRDWLYRRDLGRME